MHGAESRYLQVDFLISACSSVVLMPSLAAMVANRFGMRRDTVSYALGGMACSAGVIAVDLARRLMQVPNFSIESTGCPAYSSDASTYCDT